MRFDKRHFKWFWQRRTRGFDDRETWNLDITIAEFMIPRLKRFKEVTCGYPSEIEIKHENEEEAWAEWQGILDAMIKGFEITAGQFEEHDPETIEEMRANNRVIKKGMGYFFRYHDALWW